MSLDTAPKRRPRRDDDSPLRILILGDFSGAAAGTTEPLTARRVSVDTLESELARHRPRIQVGLDGRVPLHEELSFTALEHFHPDRVVSRIASLRELLELSQRLDNPLTEEAALRDAAKLLGDSPAADVRAPTPAQVHENKDELFARLLGRPAAEQRRPSTTTVESLIRQAVGPASGRSSSETARQRRAQVLEILTERLRSVLMLPEFRRLERAWRSVHWLVSRVEDEQAQVNIVDLPKDSLAQQLRSHSENLDASPFCALLSDGASASVIVADYEFRLEQQDLVLLATIGAIASRSGSAFIAQGDLSLCGCRSADDVERPWEWAIEDPDLEQLWSEVRRHPAAQWLGLATPRFLLRQPFGTRSDPIESFAFEELPPRPDKDAFLWGNPAFACAYVIAHGDAAEDRPWPAGAATRVPDLPVAVYDDGSGEAVQAPIERVLTERVRTAIEQHGLIAFAGSSSADYIAAGSIQPLASA